MANKGPESIGYVILGIADKAEAAIQLERLNSKYKAIKRYNHYITGVNFDIDCSGLTADRYFQKIVQEINAEPIEDEYKTYIGNNIKFLKYGDKNVVILKVKGLRSPAMYDNEYYERKGANIEKILTRNVATLLNKFTL